jgi:hypothetical protein
MAAARPFHRTASRGLKFAQRGTWAARSISPIILGRRLCWSDKCFVGNPIARREPAGGVKAIVRTAVAERSRLGGSGGQGMTIARSGLGAAGPPVCVASLQSGHRRGF